jgi:hypothetical protein
MSGAMLHSAIRDRDPHKDKFTLVFLVYVYTSIQCHSEFNERWIVALVLN